MSTRNHFQPSNQNNHQSSSATTKLLSQNNVPNQYQSTYQSFTELTDPVSNPHLFIHVASGQKVSRPWQAYIGDLDDFFERIYYYYQKSGFLCIVIKHLLQLIEILLVIVITFFFVHCVDYGILFKDKPLPQGNSLKITISDCLIPLSEVRVDSLTILLLVFAAAFWLIKLGFAIYTIVTNYAIRAFFIEALQIHDPSLYSWQEVQTRLIRAQSFCLLREGHLDELAIHNRLLRRANYMIALINKGVLPIYFRVPILGDAIFLTKGLEFNFNILFFRGVFSLFETNWKLREEVKSPSDRTECARRFAKRCVVLGCVNLFLLPFILIWQCLYAFYTYVEAAKRDPSTFATRTWSRYGRWFCRHFNEMDHELDQRLNRAHRAATRYMNSFPSPLLELIAQFVTTVSSIMFSILFVLSVYDEDVITVEHVITVMTALAATIAFSRALLPDSEPNRWTLAELDAVILQHIHYRPHAYPAHTIQARNSMSSTFVYRSTTIIDELLSPIITPLILIFSLRHRALEIVDFFRVYTLELADIGDVCTFSQFNFYQNGNRIFNDFQAGSQKKEEEMTIPTVNPVSDDDRHTTRHGKLELSLINFKLTNPTWQPQDTVQMQFIDRFTRQSKIENEVSRSTVDFRSPTTSGIEPSTSQQQRSMRESLIDDSGHDVMWSGFQQKRRRLLHLRFSEVFSEQEERDNDMSLSSLYFHQMRANQSTQQLSESQPQLLSNSQVLTRSNLVAPTGQESIPLLHHSANDPINP